MFTDLSNADVTKKVKTENRPIDQRKILIVKRLKTVRGLTRRS
jgi:hypothetical protein